MKDAAGDLEFLGHPSGGRSEVEGERREGVGRKGHLDILENIKAYKSCTCVAWNM